MKVKLIRVDRKQCQTENLDGHSFTRCNNIPTVIVTETAPAKDGLIGAMSLCDSCLSVFRKQFPRGFATTKRIRRKVALPRTSATPKEVAK